MTKNGIHLVCRGEPAYPALLLQTPDPPDQLYVQGNPAVFNQPCVSVVGSRRATEYGKSQTTRFTDFLAKRHVVVVSGLAYGIDATAHEAAIATGCSIAVIAGGLNVALMAWQEELATRIIRAGGAVVSEYPPQAPALKYHFPERNRIIAGLSHVTLVTEAREKSGALITARLAAEAGRTVMCIPHDLTRITAAGSNRLLRDGALVALEPRDTFEELLRHLSETDRSHLVDLQNTELRLLSSLKKPTSLDQLVDDLQLPSADILRQITELELEGKVTRTDDGKFALAT